MAQSLDVRDSMTSPSHVVGTWALLSDRVLAHGRSYSNSSHLPPLPGCNQSPRLHTSSLKFLSYVTLLISRRSPDMLSFLRAYTGCPTSGLQHLVLPRETLLASLLPFISLLSHLLIKYTVLSFFRLYHYSQRSFPCLRSRSRLLGGLSRCLALQGCHKSRLSGPWHEARGLGHYPRHPHV